MENNEGWIFFNIFKAKAMSKLHKYIYMYFEDEIIENYLYY